MGTQHPTRVTGSQFSASNQYTNLVPEAWNKELLRYFDQNHVYRECVNTEYEGQIKGKGDTIHIRKLGRLAVSDYSRNDTIDYQDMTSTKITISIDQQKMWAIKIDDLDVEDMDIAIMPAYARDGGFQIADVIDLYVKDLMIDGADAGNLLGSILAPVGLTQDNIYQKLTQFYEKFVTKRVIKGGESPFLVLSPEAVTLMKNAPEFILKSTAPADKIIRSGDTIANFAGFDIKISTNLTKNTAGAFEFLAGTKLGCTFGMKVNKIQKIDVLHNYYASAIRALYYYGGQVIYPECLGVMTATCTLAT